MSDNNTPDPPAYFDNLFGGIEPQPLHWTQEPPAVVVTLTQEQWQDNRDYAQYIGSASDYAGWYYGNWNLPYIGDDGRVRGG